VWKSIQDVLDGDTKGMSYTDILKKAFEQAGVPGYELTPEDGRLIDMALHWAVAGKRSEKPAGVSGFGRTGVGGPFRAYWFGHYLGSKGPP
jgi:hypothetical protein